MGTIAKQSIQGTFVTYLGVAIGFVTTFFVLTRFLTSEEIGLVRVFVDAATLFVGLAQLGTSSSIIRFFPYFKEENADGTYHGFFLFTVLVPLVGFALFALVYLACRQPVEAFFGDKSPLFVNYYYLVLPLAFFMLYQAVFETNANALMHIVLPRFVREVVVRVLLLGAYLLYAFRIISIDGFIWAICALYGVAALVNIGYVLWLLPKNNRIFAFDWAFLRARRTLARSYFLYTLFLLVSAVTSVLAPTLSSFFITAQMGLNYTGIFAIATYMAVMVSVPSRSLVAITQPELSMAIKNNSTADIQRLMSQAFSNLLLVGGCILLLIWINIDLIYALLPNGETYAVARNVVLLLGIGQLLVASFSVFLPALSYSRYYWFALLNSFVLTVSALLLNNALIPRFGMIGAAWATVLADVLYYILVVIVSTCATHTQPFSGRHCVSVGLIIAAFVLNELWLTYWQMPSLWVSSVARTVVLLGGLVLIARKMNLSPEIHALFRAFHI